MSDIVVVDASLPLKWVLREPYSREAADHLEAWSRASRPLLTPPLLVCEATNVVHQRVRRGEIPADQAQGALPALLRTLAPTIQYVPGLAGRALAFAGQFGLAATYDCHYLALAEHVAGEFWTRRSEAGMETSELFQRWDLDLGGVGGRMYAAERPRERERWHALWLLGQGWTQEHIAQALEREAHTIGVWVDAFRQRGPAEVRFDSVGGAPPS